MHAFIDSWLPGFSPRVWKEGTFLFIGLVSGVVWGVYAITGWSLGIGLAIIWIGIIILTGTQASMRGIGRIERALANTLLGTRIDPPAPMDDSPLPFFVGRGNGARAQDFHRHVAPFRGQGPPAPPSRAFAVWADAHSWRVLAWTLIRLVSGPIGGALAIVVLVVPITLLATLVTAIVYQLDIVPYTLGGTIEGQPAATWVEDHVGLLYLTIPLYLVVTPLLVWGMRGWAALHRPLATWALGPCAGKREMVAEQRAQLAEEQVRIDQDLHDSIGHMITMNVIQAGAGAHVFDTDPEFARQALKNIEERGRAAMGELDRIISTIRGDQPETRAPLPGIADIAGVVDFAHRAGIDVSAEVLADAVPPAIGRAAFGIVREALTNAARHAPGAAVAVRVVRDGDALGIEVLNGRSSEGAQPTELRGSAPRVGRGLSGIADRVLLLGGRSAIGPTPDGGFAVRALLPLEVELGPGDDPESAWYDLRERLKA